MDAQTLTGSRIRARRLDMGLRQAELARRVGISAAYLNLIEHNRRRIGGRLLVEIARALEVEPAALTETAGAALVEALQAAADLAAAAGPSSTAPELERIEEFAGRFPGWAALVAAQARRIADLDAAVEALSDRLNHDPLLSAALHELLDTASAIRASAQILVETPDIDRDWRERFQRNLAEDSARLAESARGLAGYLDAAGAAASRAPVAPQEEVADWLAANGHHRPELEGAAKESVAALAARAAAGLSPAGRAALEAHFERYRTDAAALPLAPFLAAVAELGPDPAALAGRFASVDPDRLLRRLAALPATAPVPGGVLGDVGLVIADASGTLLFARPVAGFAPPRFGSACPLWPLFEVFSRPFSPLSALIELPGTPPRRFRCWAASRARTGGGFDRPPLLEATMLLVPDAGAPPAAGASAPRPVGISCRICPRPACPARREPSRLAPAL